jgi:hypothetical protein
VAETKLGFGSMEVSYDRQEFDEFVARCLMVEAAGLLDLGASTGISIPSESRLSRPK